MIYYAYAVLCIVLTGIGQVLLKLGASNKQKNYQMYLNPYTLSGYFLLVLVTVSAVLALGGMELKVLYAIMSLNYVFTILLSKQVLKEKITHNKIIATGLILAGVILFNL